jgi:hypothetical protein
LGDGEGVGEIKRNQLNQNYMNQIINKIFDTLDDWRQLPAYQLERRADIFFGVYMKEILEKKFNDDISHVIPEFPIRRGILKTKDANKSPNKSIKIDYFAKSVRTNTVYFIELKTDNGSTRVEQDDYLLQLKNMDFEKILHGVKDIAKASKSKEKYKHLFNKLETAGLMKYGNVESIANHKIEIVYILPDPEKLKKALNAQVISFKEIIGYLSDKNDALTNRFLKSLDAWGEYDKP